MDSPQKVHVHKRRPCRQRRSAATYSWDNNSLVQHPKPTSENTERLRRRQKPSPDLVSSCELVEMALTFCSYITCSFYKQNILSFMI